MMLGLTAGAAGQPAAGGDWLDTDGHYINAHGAGVLSYGGVYYLFGEIKKGQTRLVPRQGWEDYRVPAGGVSCYASSDLRHWTYKGVALEPKVGDSASDLDTGRVIERPKVLYNKTTGKFVMWMHIDRADYGYARAGVAVSDRPEGPYRYLGSSRPNGQMSRDLTAFQDEDGRAYLVYSSENNNTMHVCLLSKDYLSPTAVYDRILIGQRREAPAMFKSRGKYYLITSLCSGWDPNAARWAVADSMLGEWRQEGNPCVGPDAETTFDSQSTFVLPLGPDSFLFMADRWKKRDLPGSGYLWLPLKVVDGKVQIRERDLERRVSVSGLALVSYSIKVPQGSKGHGVLRCYNYDDSLLIEYRSPVSGMEISDYTETPPEADYMTVGTEDVTGADSLKVEVNVGEKGGHSTPECDIWQYLQPFWEGDTVYNETVLLYSTGGGPASGRLLYSPDKVLSVRDYRLDTVYRKGIDYDVKGNMILRRPGSKMAFFTDKNFEPRRDLAWYNLQMRWVVVTYTHHDRWAGPVPGYQGDRLTGLMTRLHAGGLLTIVAYGMSITRGMDVSGYDKEKPYMPTYASLFVSGFCRWYHSAARLCNAALPGSTVAWGAEHAEQYVNPLHPDLVILDFGMNDFWRLTPQAFGDSVRTIIRKVRAASPDVAFLLLANMKFDPDYVLESDVHRAFYVGNLAGYAGELKAMEGPGVAVLDMTEVSAAIYARKKPKDCLVNPLHPNDYMARWYAQGMLAVICK
jgi:lysophospholipase L1-like esterase